MDRLSYEQYGMVVIISILIMAYFFEVIPESIILTIIYLFSRSKFEEPIHAYGLNICYVCTMTFYALLFITIRLCDMIINDYAAMLIIICLTLLATFSTSTLPNQKEKVGKLFFGRKSENGRYADLFRLIKFEPHNQELLKYEDRLKETDLYRYYIFKYIFRDELTWDETMDKLDIYERKELDKEIYAIYRTLQYVCDLKRID